MAIHKLYIDDDEMNFHLIAIHTLLDDYKLAYFINQNLAINLKKCSENEQIKIHGIKEDFNVTRFLFEDKKNDCVWSLYSNENESITAQKNNQGLFSDTKNSFLTKKYILPEFKKVNYILKIEVSEESHDLNKTIKKISLINKISTVYEINISKIKTKTDLTF